MEEYSRQEEEFGRHGGAAFPFGSRESRRVIAQIAKSGKVDVSGGSLHAGLQNVDQAAKAARQH